jgi:hypothetical protein
MSTLTPSEKDKNQAVASFACIVCAVMCVLIIMFFLNNTFRNPVGVKNISSWKQSLRNSPDKKYLELLKISLVKSLEDSTYLFMSDSALVELLEDAEIVEIKGYVPTVESVNALKGSTLEERSLQGNYFAVKINDVYVLIANEEYIPVWGTRPIERSRFTIKNKIVSHTAEKFSAVFLYSFNKTLRLVLS